jgi:hypothetical protein
MQDLRHGSALSRNGSGVVDRVPLAVTEALLALKTVDFVLTASWFSWCRGRART